MLYNLLTPFADDFILFNLFRYITFRTGCAVMTAFLICFFLMPHLITYLRRVREAGQPIRREGPESHYSKAGTPTMGGAMLLFSVLVSTLLWANLANPFIWLALLVMVGYGLIGAADDWLKLSRQNVKGLPGKYKIAAQLVIGGAATVGMMLALPEALATSVAIPFIKGLFIPLSLGFIAWALFVMIGASNAVNLTDGLDGLAIVPAAIVAACLGLISYLAGNVVFAPYLQIPHVPGAQELTILCGALVGGSMGFLWYNAPPAKIFMGDTGSLSLGGVLGMVSLITKHEIVLAIIGGLFVLETLSVIIQVFYFKATRKRIFLMAPLHHHFEKKGWSEPTVVIRFWILAVIFALIGLSTLKLR